MRHSWKVLLASAAAGGLAVGMSLASIPAGNLAAGAAAMHRGPTHAQAHRMLQHATPPNQPAPIPSGVLPPASAGVTPAGSYNWSGYAATSTTAQYFTKVAGSWTVPSVTCTPEDRLVSIWVGLDGASTTDPTVEQTGTTAQCFEGAATYYSWYEMYPAGTVEVGSTVKPGDKITASVVRTNSSYALKLTDATTSGNNISTTATCGLAKCLDESVEWISERPAYSIGIVPLAQFTSPVKFTAASATGGGTSGSITAFGKALSFTMVDATDSYPLDSTSGLNAKHNAFTNAWINSY